MLEKRNLEVRAAAGEEEVGKPECGGRLHRHEADLHDGVLEVGREDLRRQEDNIDEI